MQQHTLSIPVYEKRKREEQETSEGDLSKKCSCCGETNPPCWRRGPNGPRSLCNACGLRWKSGKVTLEQANGTCKSEMKTSTVSIRKRRRRKVVMESVAPKPLESDELVNIIPPCPPPPQQQQQHSQPNPPQDVICSFLSDNDGFMSGSCINQLFPSDSRQHIMQMVHFVKPSSPPVVRNDIALPNLRSVRHLHDYNANGFVNGFNPPPPPPPSNMHFLGMGGVVQKQLPSFEEFSYRHLNVRPKEQVTCSRCQSQFEKKETREMVVQTDPIEIL